MRILSKTSLCQLLAVGFMLVASPVGAQVGTDIGGLNLPPPPVPEDYRIDAFDENDGLPGTAMTAIVQDSAGFMWFGAQTGLSRYDGYTFTNFYHDPDDPASPLHDSIESLYVDREGTLWVSYHHGGGGLSRFDPATAAFTHFRHDPADPTSLGQDTVIVMLEDSRGALWLGTGGGLDRLDRETETFTHFRHDPDDPNSLSQNEVRVIYEDRQGVLWIGTGDPGEAENLGGGLNRFDRSTETFTRYLHDPADPTSLRHDEVQTILEDSRGTFWVGTTGDGLHIMDRKAGTFTRPFSVPVPDPCTSWFCGVSFVHEDRSGTIWIGVHAGGLLQYNPGTGETRHFEASLTRTNSLRSNQIFRAYESHDGSLWVGSLGVGALHRIVPRMVTFPLLLPEQNNSSVWGLHIAADGSLLTTIWGAGINRFDPSTGQFSFIRHDPENPTGLPYNQVSKIYEDRQGALWVDIGGGPGRGIARMDPATGRFTRYDHDPADPTSLGRNGAWCFLEDSRGSFWIGSIGGLDRLDRETGTFSHFRHNEDDPASLSGAAVTTLYEDRSGTLWVGSQGGLNRAVRTAENGVPSFERLLTHLDASDYVTALHEDTQGRFWVGTFFDGLYLFDRQHGSYERFTADDGLAEGGIDAILEDEAGFLWISSSTKRVPNNPSGRGRLSRFDPETQTAAVLGPAEGLPQIGFTLGTAARGPDGMLYFGGSGGVTAFHPTASAEDLPPKTVLTNLRVFNRLVRPGPDAPIDQPLFRAASINLQPSQNDFTVEFASLNYRDPGRTQYQYMLAPHDAGWVNAGTQHSARYSEIGPGTYVFRVRGANRYGIWSEDATTIQVRVLPPWWRTVWAYLLYGLLFIGGVFAVDRIQRRRLSRKERERARERELEQAREIEKAHIDLQQAHTSLKTTQAQLTQSEKMASLGQLTAGIAHEIKNPLNFVNNFAEVNQELTRELEDELAADADLRVADVKDLIDHLRLNAAQIAKHGKRADRIVQSMMKHASADAKERYRVEVNAFVEEYINLAYQGKKTQIPDLEVQIKRDYDERVGTVEMAPQEMSRVLLNLLGNAFDAVYEKVTKSDGDYRPEVRVTTHKVDGQVEIRVGDNGPGIAQDIREKIFEPFFTTKPTGTGTGLGLSLSYDIVTQGHGGTLTVESKEGEGATFVITLPSDSRT